jgi:hypothetical protein
VRTCPSCGAPNEALPVEDRATPFEDDPVIELGGRGRNRNKAVVAVVLLVGLAAGAYVAGRGSKSTGAKPTTTTSPTVVPTTTTIAKATTTVSSTTTTAVVAAGNGPLLPEPTGQSVYAADHSGDVYRVDLDTGAITHYDLNYSFQNEVGLAVTADGALAFDGFDYDIDNGPLYRPGNDGQGTTLFQLKPDGSVATIQLDVAASQRVADTAAGGVWLIGRNADGMPAALVDANGASTAFINIPPGLSPIVADGGGIVASTASGTFRVDQGGPRRLTAGTLIGLSARYLVTSTCDDKYRCTVRRTNRENDQVDDFGPTPGGLGLSNIPGEVSPDGNSVALLSFGANDARLVRYDLDTGEVTEITTEVYGPTSHLAWTSTGWLAHVSAGVLELTRGNERRYVDVAVGPRSASLAALAIGPTPPGSDR